MQMMNYSNKNNCFISGAAEMDELKKKEYVSVLSFYHFADFSILESNAPIANRMDRWVGCVQETVFRLSQLIIRISAFICLCNLKPNRIFKTMD